MKRLSIPIINLFIFVALSFAQTTINIPTDYSTIQLGINAASNGDTVLVQPGTYVENISFNGKNIVVGSLILTTGETTYISQTVIDGNHNGSVVTFENDEDYAAKLIGFCLTGGLGGGDWPQITGGGITCWNNSNPTITDNIIRENYSSYGGGFFCYNSNPIFERDSIVDNSADGSGGGGVCYYASPLFRDVIVSRNEINLYNGGGIYCYASNSVFTDVIISENTGVYGGGILIWESHPEFTNVTINNNHSTNCGGGIHIYTNSHPKFNNSTITNNISDYEGGGVACEVNSYALFNNVTISGNVANTNGGGITCLDNINLKLINSIVWENNLEEIYFWEYGNPNSITITYSDVQDGEEGIVTNNNGTVNWLNWNIDNDPFFVDIENADFHLQEGSPCIDAGTALFILDGDTLINLSPEDYVGSAPDMGAFESPYTAEIHKVQGQPNQFALNQNFPNPFNSVTTIQYELPKNVLVNITVYNALGQKVTTLVNETKSAGFHWIHWHTSSIGSGVYCYTIQAGDFTQTKKCLILK